MERELGITKARETLSDVVERVQFQGDTYIISRHGKPAAAVVLLRFTGTGSGNAESSSTPSGAFNPRMKRWIGHCDSTPCRLSCCTEALIDWYNPGHVSYFPNTHRWLILEGATQRNLRLRKSVSWLRTLRGTGAAPAPRVTSGPVADRRVAHSPSRRPKSRR
jgi:prevent-host-death family protein